MEVVILHRVTGKEMEGDLFCSSICNLDRSPAGSMIFAKIRSAFSPMILATVQCIAHLPQEALRFPLPHIYSSGSRLIPCAFADLLWTWPFPLYPSLETP